MFVYLHLLTYLRALTTFLSSFVCSLFFRHLLKSCQRLVRLILLLLPCSPLGRLCVSGLWTLLPLFRPQRCKRCDLVWHHLFCSLCLPFFLILRTPLFSFNLCNPLFSLIQFLHLHLEPGLVIFYSLKLCSLLILVPYPFLPFLLLLLLFLLYLQSPFLLLLPPFLFFLLCLLLHLQHLHSLLFPVLLLLHPLFLNLFQLLCPLFLPLFFFLHPLFLFFFAGLLLHLLLLHFFFFSLFLLLLSLFLLFDL
ncbi:hypothetical protein J4Q44_G00138400 [Coregonus suidteri]|uniref:Uncharacterized protein n=1 Tax=Coregonus suidteri TaxID=861788 RepID=A0AAN8M3E0_9TELE